MQVNDALCLVMKPFIIITFFRRFKEIYIKALQVLGCKSSTDS